MIVGRGSFFKTVQFLVTQSRLALDTETLGLRTFHGDVLFSIIITTSVEAFYFNFNPKDHSHTKGADGEIVETETDLPEELVLDKSHLKALQDSLFSDPDKLWYIQNAANFDMPVLGKSDAFLYGEIHCTKAIGRVEYNDHVDIKIGKDKPLKAYSLEAQLYRLGKLQKDKTVSVYINQNGLYTNVKVPGKDKIDKRLHFDRVPFKVIAPYGETDGLGTFFLGDWQERSIRDKDREQPELVKSGRTMERVMLNERRLQKTIFNMKYRGVLIDRRYCERGAAYEEDRAKKAADTFRTETGRDYSQSPKFFAEIFSSEKDKWTYTEKGNPSFDYDALKKFESPAARAIIAMRDAKSKADFYNGFLYHADREGRVHPNFNPEGAGHGRFSSSEPNFQNLSSEPIAQCRSCREEIEDVVSECPECGSTNLEQFEFLIRRALIPTPGHIFIMPDYDQMEYKFMLENACRIKGGITPLGEMVAGGFDFHDATSQNAAKVGAKVMRKQAKIANFLTLYGGGVKKLAEALGVPYDEALKIRTAIFRSAPEISDYIGAVSKTAKERGYIVNWLGRRCYFPNKSLAYRAPNYHTSGGCADVVKVAMNRIDDSLRGFKSAMVMTIHDELPIEIHENEIHGVPKMIKAIMEEAFVSKYIPLTTGMEWSAKSLGDKVKGFPA